MNKMKLSAFFQYFFTITILLFILYNAFYYLQNYSLTVEAVQKVWKDDALFFDNMHKTIASVERTVEKNIANKKDWIYLYGISQKLIDKDIIENANENEKYTIYRLSNDQLSYNYPQEDIKNYIENLNQLNEVCQALDKKLLYFQLPYKINKYNNLLPEKIIDGPNKSGDEFVHKMQEYNISYIDYREEIDYDSIDYQNLFFNGDHHWKEETAFDAYVCLMIYLKNNFGAPIDESQTDSNNFRFDTYPSSFIGSQMSQVGNGYFDNYDDFTIITPKFDQETNYTYEVYNNNGEITETRTGKFSEAVMEPKAIAHMERAHGGRDSVYLGHNPILDCITNHNVPETTGDILILQDSFSRPISAFTSLNFHRTYIADLRFNKGSIVQFLEMNPNIQYVIVSYPVSVFKCNAYKKQFKFNK